MSGLFWVLITASVGVVGSTALLVAIVRKRMAQRRAERRYAAQVQRFAEAIAVDRDAVKRFAASQGVSMAEAIRSLKQYGQACRESLAHDQRER